jgi:hypothetical protein
MMRIFGAFAGKRFGSVRHWWTDSCNVHPTTLAEGVGGNGRTSCAAIPDCEESQKCKGTDHAELISRHVAAAFESNDWSDY